MTKYRSQIDKLSDHLMAQELAFRLCSGSHQSAEKPDPPTSLNRDAGSGQCLQAECAELTAVSA